MPFNNTRKNYFQDPGSLAEAYEIMYQLSAEITTIENQLADKARSKVFPTFQEYSYWRKKANIAMAMKLKQLDFIKKWINNHGGKAPTEENDTVRPENISMGENSRLLTNSRPEPDRIIDSACNTIMQLRSLKRRLYPFYKIANAAFDLSKELGIESNDPTDVLNQLVYWLEKAGYNVQDIDGYSNLESGRQSNAQHEQTSDEWTDDDFDEWDDSES